ncbi:MAG: TonB-dependent receptor [Bacteroidetes bacterium]|nr:TonB-dependent receptor [Bacteroidota bacterium]MBU1721045.1 TonB-dependent receptor [Bacteroidota bacterium]
MKSLFLIFFALISLQTQAQDYSQTVRGRVTDKISGFSLPGANIVLVDTTQFIGAAADNDGWFRIEKVPIGRQLIKISYIGYEDQVIQVVVSSGKETVIEVNLEESFVRTAEVVISANAGKGKALNEMTTVSSRQFTIEETERYAGSRGDVARMAMNYAGVSGANDQRNDIVIRGNSPFGLLWRLEDVDIPNPNHYSSAGSTGGPVGMLNNNTLANSDFNTGAFPAEYGNALSGVFDLKLRNGNNEKREFTGQIGFNGVELGAEGPLNKNHKSSYLANYRYSTLDFMDKIGMDMGIGGIPKYQDLNFRVNFPTAKGNIAVFGLAGQSSIAMLDSKEETESIYAGEGQDLYNGSKLAMTAVSMTHFFNSNTYLKVILNGYYDEANTRIDTLDANRKPHNFLIDNTSNYRASMTAILNKKFNSRLSGKSGITLDRTGYDFGTRLYVSEEQEFKNVTKEQVTLDKGKNMLRLYNQWLYKITEHISVTPGVHFIYYNLSGSYSAEPRAGITWEISPLHKLSGAYGLHSRVQSMYVYLTRTQLPDGSYKETNKNLDFTRAHHGVLAFDATLSEHLRLKTEAYYQSLFDVPVESKLSPYSMLNSGASWGSDGADSLVNTGTGRNYGVELTLERFFSKNYYFLVTVSLFESKYTGSDGIERNTAFNGNYVSNGLIGREWKLKNGSVIFFDLKGTYAGGLRKTPIDLEQSRLERNTVYVDEKAYSEKFSDYLKLDSKLGYRKNGRKTTQEWMIYVENVTNHKNPLMETYSPSEDKIKMTYQMGIFPMMQYRIYF